MIAKRYNFDVERMAQDYPYPVEHLKDALNFYEAYRSEIDQAIEDNNIGDKAMKRLLPNARLFEAPP